MPRITLFELGPTRSARARWALLEAGLAYESVGNSVDVFRSDALRSVHPLGKLQNAMLCKRAAAVLDAALGKTGYLIDDRFSATDIIVGYTVSWCQELGLLDGFPHLLAYLERLLEREHCTLTRH